MRNLKKSSEFLIGLFTCILLVVLYWGINFLKGENLFSNKRFYYALYENIDGLTISRPVTVNGFKVGQVSNISFQPGPEAHLIVEFSIEENISFSNSSILEIYDADIMGTKSVQLKIIEDGVLALSGDTLIGTIASGLTSEVSEQFGSVKVGLDQLIISFDKVLNEVNSLSSTANRILLNNENNMKKSMNNVLSISNVVENQSKNIDNILNNISNISDSINQINFIETSNNIASISYQLNSLLFDIQSTNSSLGKLITEDSIYNQLSHTLINLDSLLIDLKSNPKKYVNFSVFGGD
ncbi:MAG: hypothetical protein CMP65_02490 [Flavobacteriales bacterium]|nr:hypothetical protein [Flavobacteriales bacterium]